MELYFPTIPKNIERNAKNGQFLKGYRRKTPPANKGRKMSEFTTPEICEKIISNLSQEGRQKGANRNKELFGRPVLAIQDGKLLGPWQCASLAKEYFMQQHGVYLAKMNILNCCKGNRKTHKGMQWFYVDEPHKWEHLIQRSL